MKTNRGLVKSAVSRPLFGIRGVLFVETGCQKDAQTDEQYAGRMIGFKSFIKKEISQHDAEHRNQINKNAGFVCTDRLNAFIPEYIGKNGRKNSQIEHAADGSGVQPD